MKKVILIFAALLITWSAQAYAEEIYLKNGEIIQGNIIHENKEEGFLKIDIVLDGDKIGAIVELKNDEIESIKKDNKYKDLKKTALSEEKKEQIRNEAVKRIKESHIEEGRGLILRERKRERARMQNYENWHREDTVKKTDRKYEKERHEDFKELMVMQHENNKELINEGAKFKIYDTGIKISNQSNSKEKHKLNEFQKSRKRLSDELWK